MKGVKVVDDDEGEALPFLTFAAWYLVILATGFAFALAARAVGFNPYRAGIAFFGLVFAFAGFGVPRRLYLVTRRVGWFASIPTILLRPLLVIGGLGILAGSLLLPGTRDSTVAQLRSGVLPQARAVLAKAGIPWAEHAEETAVSLAGNILASLVLLEPSVGQARVRQGAIVVVSSEGGMVYGTFAGIFDGPATDSVSAARAALAAAAQLGRDTLAIATHTVGRGLHYIVVVPNPPGDEIVFHAEITVIVDATGTAHIVPDREKLWSARASEAIDTSDLPWRAAAHEEAVSVTGPFAVVVMLERSQPPGQPRRGAALTATTEESELYGTFAGDFDTERPPDSLVAARVALMAAGKDAGRRMQIWEHVVGWRLHLVLLVPESDGDVITVGGMRVVVVNGRGAAHVISRP